MEIKEGSLPSAGEIKKEPTSKPARMIESTGFEAGQKKMELKEAAELAGKLSASDSEFARELKEAQSPEKIQALVEQWNEKSAAARNLGQQKEIQESKPQYSAFEGYKKYGDGFSEKDLEIMPEDIINREGALLDELADKNLSKNISGEKAENQKPEERKQSFFERHPKIATLGSLMIFTSAMIVGEGALNKAQAGADDWDKFVGRNASRLFRTLDKNNQEQIRAEQQIRKIERSGLRAGQKIRKIDREIDLMEEEGSILVEELKDSYVDLSERKKELAANPKDATVKKDIQKIEREIEKREKRIEKIERQIDKRDLRKADIADDYAVKSFNAKADAADKYKAGRMSRASKFGTGLLEDAVGTGTRDIINKRHNH